MRHLKKTKKLKRTTEERRKLFVDLSRGLIKSGKIVTFTTRAKWFAPQFERLVTLVKNADNEVLAYRRMRKYFTEDVARKMITEIVPQMKDRNGGYTRILKVSDDFSTHDKSIVLLTIDN